MFLTSLLALSSLLMADSKIVVGSKLFTEAYLLGELAAQIAESEGVSVDRRLGMGDTLINYEALKAGKIDVYPEYTGTISRAILKDPSIKTHEDLQKALEKEGLISTRSLGFSNSYVLATRRDYAEKHGLRKISDLLEHPPLRGAFSYSFTERKDGLTGLRVFYGLKFKETKKLEHTLVANALAEGKVELVEIYSTDAKIKKLDLAVLDDDRDFFPKYYGVFLVSKDFPSRFPKLWKRLQSMEGQLNESRIMALNSRVDLDKESIPAVVASVLSPGESRPQTETYFDRILPLTFEHLVLVCISMLLAILVGIPCGILASRSPALGQVVLVVSGIVQTIPSIALLCFFIPFFGIGAFPSIVALFLYSLLPIVRSTYTGIDSLPKYTNEVGNVLGLTAWQKLRLVEIPLASHSILSGIRTSAIINIGTATLAALIGAGGYGTLILAGISMSDIPTVLEGAIPAAIMALATHGVFELVDRMLIPKGLRIS